MRKVNFKNDYYISEKLEDGSIVITILNDINVFHDIDLTGCQLITNSEGLIDDKFTKEALEKIKKHCLKDKENIYLMKNELRNRTLNHLMNYL